MAGTLRVSSRQVSYGIVLEPANAYAAPLLGLEVVALEENLSEEVHTGEREGEYIRLSGDLETELAEFGPAAILPPIAYGEDCERALADYASLFRCYDLAALLVEVLEGDEVVVPVFGSAPTAFKPLIDVVSAPGTRAAIVLGTGAAAGMMTTTTVPELLLFYAGGTILVRVVDPVLTALGEGLAARIQRRFKIRRR